MNDKIGTMMFKAIVRKVFIAMPNLTFIISP